MAIEEALRTYLLTKTGLTALVSTRIVPDDISDGLAFPCVVYSKISDVKSHFLTGQSSQERPVLQFSAYATTKSAARAIADQLKTALVDYSGTLSGVVVQKIELQNEYASTYTPQEGTQKLYVEDFEFEITFIRS